MALNAMRENPNTNRREAVEKLVTAAGGKLVDMYGTIAEGPGALVIFGADPVAAAAMAGVAASSDSQRQDAAFVHLGRSGCRPAKAGADSRVL
jgi:hypothetical protein